LKQKVDSMQGEITTLQHANSKLQDEQAKIETALKNQDAVPSAATPELAGQHGTASSAAAVPYELRTLATIGNLDWDETEDVLKQRAMQVLREAGVTADHYSNLIASTRRDGKGSMAILSFKAIFGSSCCIVSCSLPRCRPSLMAPRSSLWHGCGARSSRGTIR